MIHEGMKIKTFPDTDVSAYVHWIRSQGFDCYVHESDIRVGRKRFSNQMNPELTGELIRQHMKNEGISQKKLCKLLIASEHTIRMWIYGDCVPRSDYRSDLSDVLNITPEEWESCRE